MKKALGIFLALVMFTLTFAGCRALVGYRVTPTETPGESAISSPSESPVETPVETVSSSPGIAGETLVFGFAIPEMATAGFKAIANGVLVYAEQVGVELIVVESGFDAALQISQIEELIVEGVDAIVLCPADSGALGTVVAQANEADVPVVCMDRGVTSGDIVGLVLADNAEFGYQAGLYMAEAAQKAGIALSALRILELQGDLATSAGQERSEGFQRACEERGMTIAASVPTYWDPDEAYTATLDAFQAHPSINAIFEASDSLMCASVSAALDELGKSDPVGHRDHILVATVDGSPNVIDALKSGAVDVTAAQNLLGYGKVAVDWAIAAVMGEIATDANEVRKLGPIKTTIDNADSEELWANAI